MDDVKDMIHDESLAKLLRSNLSCYIGKSMTVESLDEITKQIVESINFSLRELGGKGE
jgi:hypothetical protein